MNSVLAAAPTVPHPLLNILSFPFLNFFVRIIYKERMQRDQDATGDCKYLFVICPLLLYTSFISVATLYPSLIIPPRPLQKDTSYERREAKWQRVQGQRKSMGHEVQHWSRGGSAELIRLYKSSVVHTVSGDNSTMMVNGSQWRSAEVNESQPKST